MGTRSLTKVIQTWEDESGKKQSKPFTTMYRQYDGYLNGQCIQNTIKNKIN
jgi:ribosomal protein L34E